MIVIAAYCSTVAGSLLLLATTSPPIAFYGISGVVFAFAGFAVVQYGRRCTIDTPPQQIAFLGGLAAVITVAKDILLGVVTGSPINGGHTAGLLIGVVLALWWRPEHR